MVAPVFPYNTTTNQMDSSLVWTNENIPLGIEGSVPSFEAWVYSNTEIVNAIKAAGIVPSNADLGQLAEAIKQIVAAAIAAIPPVVIPPAPNVPNYTGSNGVAIDNNYNATLDINDLGAISTATVGDTLPIFSNGANHKITVQNLATIINSFLNIPTQSAASTATFNSVTADTNVGNNTLAVIPFSNNTSAFATGSSDRFTFTKAGLYTIDAFLQIKVNTNNDAGGGPAATARAYGAYYMYKNGQQIVSTNTNGTAYNYIAPLANLISRTDYFNVGDYIQYKISGTGDGFNSNGCYISANTYATINNIV